MKKMSSRGTTIYITLDGVTRTLKEWAMEKGISYTTVYHRYRNGIRGEWLFSRKVLIMPEPDNVTWKRIEAVRELWHGKWVYVGT